MSGSLHDNSLVLSLHISTPVAIGIMLLFLSVVMVTYFGHKCSQLEEKDQ